VNLEILKAPWAVNALVYLVLAHEHNIYIYIKEFRLFQFQNGDSGIRPSVAEPENSVAKLPDSLAHPVCINCTGYAVLTLSLLMCTYMELLVKPEILTSYVYEPTFDNTEPMQKVILWLSCV
jgi:hypothetical protein